MRYTSKDIAKLANVSRGTVDRVIHNRGKVSDEARKKVEKVLEEIHYQPNVLAKALQANQLIKIAVLMPSPGSDVFWKEPVAGILEAQANTDLFDVTYDIFYFDNKNKDDFKRITTKVIESAPDGVIFAPFFYHEALDFLSDCKAKQLPCVSFNTHIDSDYLLSFIGQDLYLSGRVAAGLLHKITPVTGTILIVHFNENISNAMHMQEKEMGFKDFYEEKKDENWKIRVISIVQEDQQEQFEYLDVIFRNDPNIVATFVTTSKTYRMAQYFKYNDISCRLIGYDLLDDNIQFLESGEIDFLIHQNPKQQALLAAIYMADVLTLKKKIPKEILLPLDIISKENILSYLKES